MQPTHCAGRFLGGLVKLAKTLFGARRLNIRLSGSSNIKAIKLLYVIEVYETIRNAVQNTSWSRSQAKCCLQRLNLNVRLVFFRP